MKATSGDFKKLRVLCLHGFQTNARIMEYQSRHWRSVLGSFVEFEFINGKYERNPYEIEDVTLKNILQENEKVYSWVSWRSKDSKLDLLRDMQYVIDHIEQHGPYDGMMGFSQGGGVINSLIQFQFAKILTLKSFPCFFAIVNAPYFHMPLKDPQIDVPTFHCFSPQDDMLSNYPEKMSTFYKSPLTISHSFGHKFPKLLPDQVEEIIKFMQNAVHFSKQKEQAQKNKLNIPHL